MTRVEWRHTIETSRLLRVLAATALGAIGSVFVLGAGLLAFVVATSLLAGEIAVLAVIAFAGVLLARRLAVHVALVGSGDVDFSVFVSTRVLVAASVVWAVAIAAVLALDAPFVVVQVSVAVAVFVLLPAVAALRSEGYVDTKTSVLHVRNRDTDIALVDRVSRYSLGPVAVLWVRYHDGAGATAPRLFGVPATDATAIETALEASDTAPPDYDGNLLVAKTLYAFGLGASAFAVALAYFAFQRGGDAAVVGTYAALLAGLFGVLFLWLGYVEG